MTRSLMEHPLRDRITIPVVYIAGPYRGPDAWTIECNIRRAETLALEVWRLGAAALCPHANTRFFQGAANDEIWLAGDLALLAKCDALLLTADWERSSGARAEVDFATARMIPVFRTLTGLAQWMGERLQRRGESLKARDGSVSESAAS